MLVYLNINYSNIIIIIIIIIYIIFIEIYIKKITKQRNTQIEKKKTSG